MHPSLVRIALLFIAFLACFPARAESTDDFNGAWVAWICPSGVKQSSGKCANFVLELMQKDGKLCGAHMYATAGAERIDEGAAPSVNADIAGGTASGVAISGLAGRQARVPMKLILHKGVLRWQRLDSPSGDSLLPRKASLTRAKSRTLFAPLFEQELRAACIYIFNVAARAKALDEAGAPGMPGTPSERPR